MSEPSSSDAVTEPSRFSAGAKASPRAPAAGGATSTEAGFWGAVPTHPVPLVGAGRARFYVITGISDVLELMGVWWAPWAHVKAFLPAPLAEYPNYVPGFDSWEAAKRHVEQNGCQQPMVRRA